MTANGNRQDERNKNMANSTLDALRSAYAPESLEADLNERLIQAALAGFSSANGQQPPVISRPIAANTELQDSAPTTDSTAAGPADIEQGELLRLALDGEGSHPLSDLAELLRSAYAPSSADVSFDDLLIPDTRHVHTHDQVTRFRFGSYAAATLALAAGIALWLMHLEEPKLTATAEQREQLVQSRSVAPLFAETFDSKTPTERIDRIVAIRSRELRQNRYATWSVR